ncbi:MAG: hypothetical protein Q8S33_03765 [Myxococcales bacterium]|nr:hypothetical protein [Myxococcales bacterium]
MMSIGLGELLLCSVAVLLPILGVVGIVLLARGTKQKTDFGLNPAERLPEVLSATAHRPRTKERQTAALGRVDLHELWSGARQVGPRSRPPVR